MTLVRNRWYVAAWDSEVDRAPLALTICGETLVLWRKLDRSVVALRDACPHRLLRRLPGGVQSEFSAKTATRCPLARRS